MMLKRHDAGDRLRKGIEQKQPNGPPNEFRYERAD